MKPWIVPVFFVASTASAEVAFLDRSSALPAHDYSGGWEHFVGGGLALFDCNSDGLPDIYAAGGENPAMLIVNQGAFQFRRADVPELRAVTGAYPIDLDGDGFKDLFVLRIGTNVILKGGPDCSFAPMTGQFSISDADQWSTAFSAWWEEDASGPVLAVGNYVDRSAADGPFEACDTNEILWPSPDGYRSETLAPGFCALSILAAEDARGHRSLRLSNDRHYYVKGGYEQMWDTEGHRFLTEEDGWPTVSLWGMGIASRDLTGDDRDEVMLTSMGDQLMQIAMEDGSYQSAPYDIGTYAQRPHVGGDGRPSTGWHAEFGDVNNDGRADLFIAKGNVDQMPGMATRDPNNLLLQGVDGRFSEVSVKAGVASTSRSRGGGLADFDGDGRLDLIVSNRRAPLELYQNVSSNTGNWFSIELRQDNANRDAIGARIAVETNGFRQSVQHVIGGGHAGGQLLPRHFGIGDAKSADVTVTWPDGTTSRMSADAGKRYRLVKP